MSAIGAERATDRLVARWPALRPFAFAGSLSTIAGGVTAAITGPTGFELGPWLAAFLVLVGGVAQIALGIGQAWLSDEPPSPASLRAEVITWNVGMAATIAGSLLAAPAVTTLGGVVFAVALCVFLRSVPRSGASPRWARLLYRWLVAVVLLSTPVGLVLAWIRHG
jgi:hypothetical protein